MRMLKKTVFFAVILVIASIALKLWFVFTYGRGQEVLSYLSDSGYEITGNLLKGEGYNMTYLSSKPLYSFRPPLYPLFLFVIFSFFGKNILLLRVIYIGIVTFIAYFTYLIGKRVFNNTVGAIASLAVLFYPPLIFYVVWTGPEAISTLILTATVFLIVSTSGWSNLKLVFLGLMFSLLMYSQSNLAGLAPILIVYSILTLKKERWKKAAIILFSTALFLSPWIARNFIIHKKLVFTSGTGLAFASANNPDVLSKGSGDYYYAPFITEAQSLSELERDRYLMRKGLEFIARSPLEYAKLSMLRFWRIWRPYFQLVDDGRNLFRKRDQIILFCIETPLLLFFLLGILFAHKKKEKKLWLFYAIFAYFTIAGTLMRAKVSYRFLYSPLIIVIASFGLIESYRRVKALRNKNA
ncbi:MAG: glycosyltransferase family 39 protein [Candidatus Omnitrophota bacterium]